MEAAHFRLNPDIANLIEFDTKKLTRYVADDLKSPEIAKVIETLQLTGETVRHLKPQTLQSRGIQLKAVRNFYGTIFPNYPTQMILPSSPGEDAPNNIEPLKPPSNVNENVETVSRQRQAWVILQYKVRDAGAASSRPGEDRLAITNPEDVIIVGRHDNQATKSKGKLEIPENEKSVSRTHCELHPGKEAGTFILKDKSKTGTFILCEKLLVLEKNVRFDIGNILFSVKELDVKTCKLTLRIETAYSDALKSTYVGREFELNIAIPNRIGKDTSCHVPIPDDPFLTPTSAQIQIEGGSAIVSPVGQATIWKRLRADSEGEVVRHGDYLRFGEVPCRLLYDPEEPRV